MSTKATIETKSTSWVEFFAIGVHLAGVQFSFLFLLEAYLSSRSVSYFICLFFWLIGFLAGLNLPRALNWRWLVGLGWVSYQVCFVLNQNYPYRDLLYPIFAVAIALSAIQAGYFFRMVGEARDGNTASALFHENNGFIVGMAFSLIVVLYAGRFYLALFPTCSAALALAAIYSLNKKGFHPDA